MKSAELNTSTFNELMEYIVARLEFSQNEHEKGNEGVELPVFPKGTGSVFGEAHEKIVALSKEPLPSTIKRLQEGLSGIVKQFREENYGLNGALEAAVAIDYLKEATLLSCCVDPNIRRALQLGLWAGELAVSAKSRYAETPFSIGAAMQRNAKIGADSTRKHAPSKRELTTVLKEARAKNAKESAVDKAAAKHFGVGVTLLRRWKAELGLLKRPTKKSN